MSGHKTYRITQFCLPAKVEDLQVPTMPISQEKLESARPFIPNLRYVSERLTRGGQPDPAGLSYLKDAGVRTIVNLCGGQSGLVSLFRRSAAAAGDNPELELERKTARQLDMDFVSIPLEVFQSPSEQALQEFVDVISQADQPPIFVHCLHGRDRTGLMMAVYRVVCDGWDADKAYVEMVECGFDPQHTRLSEALFSFAAKRR